MRMRDKSELKFGLNVAERLLFRGPWFFCVSESSKYVFFFLRNVRPGGGFQKMGFQVASLALFLYFWASPTAILKYHFYESQATKINTEKRKLNNMAVTLRVSISFFISFKSPKYWLQWG